MSVIIKCFQASNEKGRGLFRLTNAYQCFLNQWQSHFIRSDTQLTALKVVGGLLKSCVKKHLPPNKIQILGVKFSRMVKKSIHIQIRFTKIIPSKIFMNPALSLMHKLLWKPITSIIRRLFVSSNSLTPSPSRVILLRVILHNLVRNLLRIILSSLHLFPFLSFLLHLLFLLRQRDLFRFSLEVLIQLLMAIPSLIRGLNTSKILMFAVRLMVILILEEI